MSTKQKSVKNGGKMFIRKIAAKLPGGNIRSPVFSNGIIRTGLCVLFDSITAASAAVLGPPPAQGAPLDEAGCQSFSLDALGLYLPDPRAATGHEYKIMDG